MSDQIPFGTDIGIADNPEPRLPCVLLLDVSKSMAGPRIGSLNEGLRELTATSCLRTASPRSVSRWPSSPLGAQSRPRAHSSLSTTSNRRTLSVSGNTPGWVRPSRMQSR